jgi:hypothetical protein
MLTIRSFNTQESLSNCTTFRQIYSGATVPLKESDIKWETESSQSIPISFILTVKLDLSLQIKTF